jgi:hypothetical protein
MKELINLQGKEQLCHYLAHSQLLVYLGVQQEELLRTGLCQHRTTWNHLPGHIHGKLFISGPCKKRAEGLLKLSRHQIRLVVAFLTGHGPVRKHLNIMGLFDGDPSCRFCKSETETVYHIICRCEALARQRYKYFGKLFAEPKDTSMASLKDLCLFVRGTGLMNHY